MEFCPGAAIETCMNSTASTTAATSMSFYDSIIVEQPPSDILPHLDWFHDGRLARKVTGEINRGRKHLRLQCPRECCQNYPSITHFTSPRGALTRRHCAPRLLVLGSDHAAYFTD
jgi:hypothetical protein